MVLLTLEDWFSIYVFWKGEKNGKERVNKKNQSCLKTLKKELLFISFTKWCLKKNRKPNSCIDLWDVGIVEKTV